MAIKISGSTIIDDSRNIVSAGVVTATRFVGSASSLTNIPASQLTGSLPAIDGSALLNVSGSGSGVNVRTNGSPVGVANTIDFGSNLSVTFSSGTATVNAGAGGGGGVSESLAIAYAIAL